MKRILLVVVCSCLMTGTFAQKSLTSAQKNFQNSIVNFLKEEGYAPSIDNDGWIAFKSEGKSFWIIIESESPFFVVFKRSGFKVGGSDGFKYVSSLLACNEVNKELRAVKMYCDSESVLLQIEQYTRSAEDFKYAFYKNLEVLAVAAKKFVEEYETYEE